MRYDGKLHCMKLETGSMIYAIIRVIFTSIAIAVTIGNLIFFNVILISQNKEPQTHDQMQFYISAAVADIVFMVLLSYVGVAFAFSVVLLVGVCKKKPNHVKAFFIYGLVNIVISAVVFLIAFINMFDSLAFFILCATDGLLLHMIRLTYLKFQGERVDGTFTNAPKDVEKL